MYKTKLKRIFDFFTSVIMLLLFTPIMLLISVGVFLFIDHQVIFSQKRPGLNEHPFKMYKFKTMIDKYDDYGQPLEDAQRITKFGNFLRKYSLDELPELYNIMIGDMSFVGPRPQLIIDMIFMSDTHRKRHAVRPGLTGLAQISGRNKIDWNKKLDLDLEYLKNINFKNDFIIILKTFIYLFKTSDTHAENHVSSLDYGDYLLANNLITKKNYDKIMSEFQRMPNE